MKTFKIRSDYRFGLNDKVKDLMKKRDSTIKQIGNTVNSEKTVLLKKYKILRNKVTNLIRQENIDFNNKRIAEAKNEGEM